MKWLGLLLTLFATLAFGQGRVFNDDFEAGLASQWQADGPFALCAVVTTAVDGGAPHSGTHQAECNWDGTAAWGTPQYVNSHKSLKLPTAVYPYTREVFFRIWGRYETDVQNQRGNDLIQLFPNNGGWHPNALEIGAILDQPPGRLFAFWNTEGNTGDASVPGGFGPAVWGNWYYYDNSSWVNGVDVGLDQCDAPTPPTLCRTQPTIYPGDRAWHKYEVYIKTNTPGNADGIARLWVDGVRTVDVENDTTVDPVDNGLWGPLYLVGSNNTMNTPNNHTVFDGVEVFTDQGTGGVGSMSDASIVQGSCH